MFIKGGDQWDYVSGWRGTLTERAIREVFLAGGVVAGTSAGAAVLGAVVFDARNASALSRTALRNPRTTDITLTTDFLRLVEGCFFDTHFYERGRFGRLLAILARCQADSGRRVLGVGLESETALCISPGGTAEVMGAGSVVFYYPTAATRVSVAPNAPLVYTDIRFDALVDGYTYDMTARRAGPAPSGAVVPGPGSSAPAVNAVTIFGDAFPGPEGITQLIASSGGTGRNFAVVTSPGTAPAGQRFADTLAARGAATPALVLLDGLHDSSAASVLGNADGIVFASNLSEQFPALIDSTTLAGRALLSKLSSGVSVAYAAGDAKLSGGAIVFRTELEEYAAYRGKLTLGKGMSAFGPLIAMPLVFQSDVYDWNRVAGLPWAMAKTDGKTGVYVDEGAVVTISPGGIMASAGPTPAVIIDARGASAVGYSTFRHSGSAGPRQSTALIGATIHAIAGDCRFNAVTGEIVTGVTDAKDRLPASPRLIRCYPNPFNPVTTIEYEADGGPVSLDITDQSGRRVAVLLKGAPRPGTYSVGFDGGRLASGVYYARLTGAGRVATLKLMLIK